MLSSVGINLNFAPVCDMATEQNQIMYSRSLGGTLEDTQTYVKNTTEISQTKGVSVALKHFPGYGTTPDSLDSVVTDEREVSSFESNDFLPFKAGIDKNAHCVMMSNLYVKNLDPNCVVSLSDYAHTVRKNELKFSGLTITDNLNNADYSQYANNNNVYVQAVLAGNDMIMVDNIDEAYKAILDAVNDGTIKQEVLQKACMRVLAYKYTAGIIK
jgi:beta-N-acetylhexosaminidase